MQQPPQQQAFQPAYQQPGAGAKPEKAPYAGRGWHVTKITFNSVAIALSVIVIGISGSLATRLGEYAVVWTAPQAVVSFGWGVAEVATALARKSPHRGIAPGASTALHLLLWLGFLCAAALNGWLLGSLAYSSYLYYYSGSSYRYSVGYINSATRLYAALVAFCVLLVIVHFFLFVRACIETSRVNRSTSHAGLPPQVIYVQAPPAQQQQPAYYPQQQQQYAPQQPAPPQQAHLSGHWQPPQQQHTPVQSHATGDSGSRPQSMQPGGGGPSSQHEDGLHPVPAGHHAQ